MRHVPPGILSSQLVGTAAQALSLRGMPYVAKVRLEIEKMSPSGDDAPAMVTSLLWPFQHPGTHETDVPAERREQPCLDDAELAEILELARRVERDAGVPQDGEFAVAEPGGPVRVHLLQTRPETVWSTRAPRAATSGAQSALSAVLATLTRGATATSPTPEGTPDHAG